MSFWPNDIFSDQILSPHDIMANAGKELTTRSKSLSFEIRESRLGDRIVLAFIITNTSHDISLNLLEVSHRLDKTYPAVIDPPASDIPEFLKRERRIPGSGGFSAVSAAISLSITGASPDRVIKNEWVCATPEEFTEKLTKLLSLDYVKSNLMSLMAPTPITVPPSVTSESTPPSDKVQEDEIES